MLARNLYASHLRGVSGRNTMESFVVQIYRRGADSPETLVGVVEKIGVGEARSFHGMTELWRLLGGAKVTTGKRAQVAKQALPEGKRRIP